MKQRFYFLTILSFFLACTDGPGPEAEIMGSWQGISWKADGKETGRPASQVYFKFEPTGTYAGSFGDQSEQGSYYTRGDKLYTQADDQMEKMVQYALSGKDTLLLLMNRGGTMEELRLVRKQE